MRLDHLLSKEKQPTTVEFGAAMMGAVPYHYGVFKAWNPLREERVLVFPPCGPHINQSPPQRLPVDADHVL